MRRTERKLKKLAKELPKSKTALPAFGSNEEKSPTPLFSKLAVPVMIIFVCFSLTLVVSAEVREAIFGLFKSASVSSEQSSSEDISSSYEYWYGPKKNYTSEDLAAVLPTETKDGVDEFAELFEGIVLNSVSDSNHSFNKETFKETVINVTPKNVSEKTDVQIFQSGREHLPTGSDYYIVYDGKVFAEQNAFLTSALVCDSNDDGNEEIVIAFFHNTYGLYPHTRLFVFDTATKSMIPSGWIYEESSVVYSTLTYASEESALDGIFFYVLRSPMKYTEDGSIVLDHSESYTTIGDIRLNDEGELYYHEYSEEELAEIEARE